MLQPVAGRDVHNRVVLCRASARVSEMCRMKNAGFLCRVVSGGAIEGLTLHLRIEGRRKRQGSGWLMAGFESNPPNCSSVRKMIFTPVTGRGGGRLSAVGTGWRHRLVAAKLFYKMATSYEPSKMCRGGETVRSSKGQIHFSEPIWPDSAKSSPIVHIWSVNLAAIAGVSPWSDL